MLINKKYSVRENRRRVRAQRGALLIEVLLTIVVMSACLTLIIQSFLVSLRAAVYSADCARAVILADNKMFDLMKTRFVEPCYREENNPLFSFAKYRCKVETSNIPQKFASVNKVRIAVFWDAGQKEKNIWLSTYLLNKGSQ